MFWILIDRVPVPVPDIESWEADRRDFESNFRVGWTVLPDGSEVSTVFVGLDHNWLPEGDPILFETMVFGGPLNGEQERYSTFDEAEKGHREMVARCFETGAPKGPLEESRDA